MGCNCQPLTPEQEELRKRILFWLKKDCPHCNKKLDKIVVRDKPILKCPYCYQILENKVP